jgi:integrase
MQGRNFVVKIYEPALKRAKIEGVTWHTLRHTFASRAVMAGVDIRTVQELMGHSHDHDDHALRASLSNSFAHSGKSSELRSDCVEKCNWNRE